ncbi:MAG TPA: Hsp20/alpha crystallin family protein, partial [Blastocatellia bacterium]|nr:Hsp20/alpha crystallin family protein [Blastocatellia bacterium]
ISLRLSKIPTWAPNSEISETPGEYIIDVELAGVDQADVTVQHLNNILVVRGTRRFHKKSEEAHCHSSERKYGTFERYFALPYYLQPENLKLEFSNGVLEIVIPRGERSGDGKA